jgi:hypothetical protein
MKCLATFSENQILHKMKLRKIQVRTLNGLYHRPRLIRPDDAPLDNPRLRLRFKEAIEEAQEICELDVHSEECHLAWYEVDELEDSLMRR